MITIESKTGAEIKIAPAPFKDAIALKNAIFKELAKTGINIDNVDFMKTDINDFIKPLMQIDSSKEFYDAFFKCAARCLYNDMAIKEDIFEDTGAREDYYLVLIEVLKANLAPFFKGLVSSLSTVLVGQAPAVVEQVQK